MENPIKDSDGILYKFPERTCKKCKKYPCMANFDKLVCDFAKYGCITYKEQPSDSTSR